MRAWSASASMRTSVTAFSSSVAFNVHVRMLDDAGDRDHLVPPHDERPRLALGTGNLGVHEYVLDLLAAAGEPVARAPPSYLKAFRARPDHPPAPADLAVEIHRSLLEPEAVVLAHGHQPAAEVDAPRARRRCQQVGERRRQRLPRIDRLEDVLVRSGMQAAQERKD